MRIFCDGSVIRAPVSGVQLAVREQLVALLGVAHGQELTVFALDAAVRAAAARAGAALGPLPRGVRRVGRRILWQQFRLPMRLDRGGADVLFAPAYTAPLRCPTPYVLQVHDTIAFEHPEYCSTWNVRHMRALAPGSIRRAAAVLAPSRVVADAVRRLFDIPPERTHVVPLGVDCDRFSPPAAGHPPPPPSGVAAEAVGAILFVGNLEPKKGLEVLISAYARSADRLHRDLVLAGRPAWKSHRVLAAVRSYTGPGRVRLLGRVPDDELPALYRGADVFVFPSLTEGFGLPVLEAMAAGTPVVHSDAPALVETAGGAGTCVPRGDPDALAAALVRLLESPDLRAELAARGRAHAQTFTWRRWAEAVLPILRRVGTARPPG
ncbi:MAG: glycosyltransferase family 4 protein [Kiritimatiellaeota bacterium]|nr:glycosyltransferase family 4 protein [Kiritimatiellota bacterium]